MRTVCVVSSSRADYGLLSPMLHRLIKEEGIVLRLAVTGTHLSSEYSNTVEEIEQDGIPIHVRIPILPGKGDPISISQVMANAIVGFDRYFTAHRPDLLVVLGDRYEICALCTAAANARIPIAHLHGGETTEGAVDECYRHAITKMSYLHFTANESYRKRVIQLGEAPERVFNVGALGVENALNTDFMTIEELEQELGFELTSKSYGVVTFHPVTLEEGTAMAQLDELLEVLGERRDMNFIITKSNADEGGREISAALDAFGRQHCHCKVVASLGVRRYMSALKYAACVIGNSSSGLVEVPAFGIPTVNIGDRQRGRMQAESVINCAPDRKKISRALDKALSVEFRQVAAKAKNPYENGNTSEQICSIIKWFMADSRVDLKKRFYDVVFEE